MTSGLVALTRWQATIESAYGTGGTATRVVPMVGTPKDALDVFEGQQDRGTLEDYYSESIVATKRHVEVTGATSIATFEDVPWWLQLFVKGGVTGATGITGATAAVSYTFTPTITSDDLSTACFEWGTDTAAYVIPGCVGKKLELTFDRSQPVMLGIDLIGQKMTSHTFTDSLTQSTKEAMQTGLTTAYVDTSTYGSTNPGTVLNAKVVLDNGTEALYPLGGNAWSTAYGRARRHLAYEATIQFSSTTEYDAFVYGTARKLRLKTTGTQITGSSPAVYKSMTIDLWVPRWKVADFGRTGTVWTVKVQGSSAYESSLGASFAFTIVNDLATLP